jgi:hypothetical protein
MGLVCSCKEYSGIATHIQALLLFMAAGVPHFIPPEEVYFACDTEVADIDVKSQSPVGHGTVICFSIYAGPWAHFSTTGSGSSSSGVVAAAAVAAEAGGDGAAAGQQQQQQQHRPPVGRIWVDLTGGWQRRMEQEWEAAQQQAAAEREAQLHQQQQELSAAAGAAAKGGLGNTAAAARRQVSRRPADPSSGQLYSYTWQGQLYSYTQQDLEEMSLKSLKEVGKHLDLPRRSTYTAAQRAALIEALVKVLQQQQQQQGSVQVPGLVQELGQQQHLQQQQEVSLQEPRLVQESGQQQLADVLQKLEQGAVQQLLQDQDLQNQGPEAGLLQQLEQQQPQQEQQQQQQRQLAGAEASGAPQAEQQAATPARRRRSPSMFTQSRSSSWSDPAISFPVEQQPLPPSSLQAQQQQLQASPADMAARPKNNTRGELLKWMQKQYAGVPWLRLANDKTALAELHDLLAAATTGGPLVVPASVEEGIIRRVGQRQVRKDMVVALLEFYQGAPYSGDLEDVTISQLLKEVEQERDRRAAAAGTSDCSSGGPSSSGIERGGGGLIAALAQLQPAAAAVDSPVHSSSSSSSEYSVSPDGADSMPLRRRRSSSNTNSWGSPLPPPSSLAVHGVLGSVAALAPPSLSDLAADESAVGILREFQRFFCSGEAKKVWHNYGFDRHVMDGLLEGVLGGSSSSSSSGSRDEAAEGSLRMQGFAGDTLHMSRLHDASRKTRGGYGLEALSSDKQVGCGGLWQCLGARGLLGSSFGLARVQGSAVWIPHQRHHVEVLGVAKLLWPTHGVGTSRVYDL